MTKEQILAEIKRTSEANGGVPIGVARFSAETGITTGDWQRHWARWGDAVKEAGLTPNQLNAARTDEDVLGSLATFVRELGRFPVTNEIKLRARNDPGFPWHNTFARFGGMTALAERLRLYCQERGYDDVVALCSPVTKSRAIEREEDAADTGTVGYVYLVRHGSRREYKIGRTNNPIRREGELRTELPEQLRPVHQIETDDPAGIERYWHVRFEKKRKNGEWFALDTADVRAFKRWRRIY